MRCLTDAWTAHETELRRFLRHRAKSEAEGDDLLQEVFLRAMRPRMACAASTVHGPGCFTPRATC